MLYMHFYHSIYKVIYIVYTVLFNSSQYDLHICCIIEINYEMQYALYTVFLMFRKMLHIA